jgi:hypothetical protein
MKNRRGNSIEIYSIKRNQRKPEDLFDLVRCGRDDGSFLYFAVPEYGSRYERNGGYVLAYGSFF